MRQQIAPPAALVLGGAEPTPQESAAARAREPSKQEKKRGTSRSHGRQKAQRVAFEQAAAAGLESGDTAEAAVDDEALAAARGSAAGAAAAAQGDVSDSASSGKNPYKQMLQGNGQDASEMGGKRPAQPEAAAHADDAAASGAAGGQPAAAGVDIEANRAPPPPAGADDPAAEKSAKVRDEEWAKKVLQEQDAEVAAKLRLHFSPDTAAHAESKVLALGYDGGSEGNVVRQIDDFFHLALTDLTEQWQFHNNADDKFSSDLVFKKCHVVKGKQAAWAAKIEDYKGPEALAEALGWFRREVDAMCVKMSDVEEKDRQVRESEEKVYQQNNAALAQAEADLLEDPEVDPDLERLAPDLVGADPEMLSFWSMYGDYCQKVVNGTSDVQRLEVQYAELGEKISAYKDKTDNCWHRLRSVCRGGSLRSVLNYGELRRTRWR